MKFEDFTKLYSLPKTLRFEAKPIGATRENIIKSGLLEEDKHRAESYVRVKKLIDEYHKAFIDNALDCACLQYEDEGKENSLQEYQYYYFLQKKDDSSRKSFSAIQQSLRNQIVKKLTSAPEYKRLFSSKLIESYKDETDKKKLIASDLFRFIDGADASQLLTLSKEEAKALVNEFSGFTSYFVGFHKNRENMYSSEEKSTGIAYRLINENLPKFIDNMEVFKKIMEKPEMSANMEELRANLEEYLNVESIPEMFELNYYNMLLTQKQIDVYNAVIGGKTDGNSEIKGINQLVNLYNQHHKDAKLPKLKTLFKQILSDRNAISWLPEEFDKDQDVLNAINDCYVRLTANVLGNNVLKSLLSALSDYNTEGVFIRNDLQLTEISQKMAGSWNYIQDAIKQDIKNVAPARTRKESEEDYEERITKIFKNADSFSIKYIDDCLNRAYEDNAYTLEWYFATLGATNTSSQQCENLFAQIANAYTDISPLLSSDYSVEKNLAQDKENVAKIKTLLDRIKSLQHFVKPLLGKGDESDKDERFYGELSMLWTELDTVTPLYNMVRNYMTRKPYSQKKIKLNFENPQLLGGWDANKERDYASILLRRDGKFYLAIMDKDSKKLLGKPMPSDGDCYEKMVYKFFKDITTMIPKCSTQLKAVKEHFFKKQCRFCVVWHELQYTTDNIKRNI